MTTAKKTYVLRERKEQDYRPPRERKCLAISSATAAKRRSCGSKYGKVSGYLWGNTKKAEIARQNALKRNGTNVSETWKKKKQLSASLDYKRDILRPVTSTPARFDPSVESQSPQRAPRFVASKHCKRRTFDDLLEEIQTSDTVEVDEYGLSKKDYKFCKAWMLDRAMPDNEKNVTIPMFREQCLEQYFGDEPDQEGEEKIHWTDEIATDIVKNKLKLEFGKTFGGFYFKKATSNQTRAHRTHFLELLKTFENSPAFVVLYFDESQFRVNSLPRKAWFDPKDPRTRIDTREKRGSGLG